MNANKGVFGLNLAHLWGERRFAAAVDGGAAHRLRRRRLKAIVAKAFPLARAGEATPFCRTGGTSGRWCSRSRDWALGARG